MKNKVKSIAYLLLIIFMCSCSNDTKINQEDYISIDSMIENKYDYFIGRYDQMVNIDFWNNINKLNKIIEKLVYLSDVRNEDIDKYMNELGEIDDFNKKNIEILKGTKNDKIIFHKNLKMLQYSLYSFYESLIYTSIYNIDMVKPIVVAEKSQIKLGDTYKCKIYLVAANRKNEQIVIINDDTLKCCESKIPCYQITPSNQGEYKIEGKMRILNFTSDTYYPFEINFSVVK